MAPLPAARSYFASVEEDLRASGTVAGEQERRPQDYSMADWGTIAPEPKFGPLSWEIFPFQAPTSQSTAGKGLSGLYGEDVAAAEEVVLMKSAQIGASGYSWRWGARRADTYTDTVIYVFPYDKDVVTFARERIDPSIEESTYLQSRMPRGHVNNAHQKRIGQGFVNLRGSKGQRASAVATSTGRAPAAQAQSTAADSIVFDEYDLLDQATVEQYERRLAGARQAGRTPRVRRLGYPVLGDGAGIAEAYRLSDQRRWHVHCQECDTEQVVTWDHVRWETSVSKECRPGHDSFENEKDVIRAWRACEGCGEELDVANGRWLAEYPERRVVGFHINRLMVPRADLVQIVRNSRKRDITSIEAFYHNDLGQTYSPAEASLSKDRIEAACARGPYLATSYDGHLLVTMGVDAASERALNVRISVHDDEGVAKPLWIGTVDTFPELIPLIEDFSVDSCAIDHLPETHAARGVINHFGGSTLNLPGRVFLVRYDHKVEAASVRYDKKSGKASIHRLEAIEAVFTGIREGTRELPKNPPPGYVDQLARMRRRRIQGQNGTPRYVYVTVDGKEDDFVHAEAYDLAAKLMWDYKQMVLDGVEEERVALTPGAGFDIDLDSGLSVDLYDEGGF